MNTFVVLAAVMACASANPGITLAGLQYSTLGVQQPLTYSVQSVPALTYSSIGSPAVISGYSAQAIVAPAYTKTQYHAQDELGQASYGYAFPGQAHAAARDAGGNVRGSYAYVDPNGKEVRVNYVADSNGYRAESNALPQGPVANLVGPAPVQDTPEVVEARRVHAIAIQEATARSGLRKKRDVSYTIAGAPLTYTTGTHLISSPALTYSSGVQSVVPAVSYAGVSPLTYSGVPSLSYSGVPSVSYSGVPSVSYSGVPALTSLSYSGIGVQAVRDATLTKVVNTPGHAVSYRVD